MYEKVIVVCEGQSEEFFVNHILHPYLKQYKVYVTPHLLGYRGGVSHYSQIRNDIRSIGRDTSVYITTMLDYYKLPQDVPGVRECKETEPERIGQYIEEMMYIDLCNELNCKAYLPNLLMHEYEALLFSDSLCFRLCDSISEKQVKELGAISNRFTTPEHINNSEQTAPSKRIKAIYPLYQKVIDSTTVAKEIGIETMLNRCPHFASWVEKLVHISQ